MCSPSPPRAWLVRVQESHAETRAFCVHTNVRFGICGHLHYNVCGIYCENISIQTRSLGVAFDMHFSIGYLKKE